MEKILLGRIAVMVTERCNLRCRLCAPMTPYWKNTHDIPLDRLKREMEELFSIVDHVWKCSVGGGGGEPFLSGSLPDFLEHIVRYQDKVDQFDIVTNGTVVPGEELLAALKSFDHMKVIVDNYGPEVSKRFEKVCQALERAGVTVERRENNAQNSHFDGWFDMLEVVNPPRTAGQAREIFDKCIFSRDLRCNVVYDGKVFPCSRALAFHHLEQIPKEDDLYLDLFDESITAEEKAEELRRHIAAEYFPACAYCQGGLRTHKRHVPAEQLGQEP